MFYCSDVFGDRSSNLYSRKQLHGYYGKRKNLSFYVSRSGYLVSLYYGKGAVMETMNRDEIMRLLVAHQSMLGAFVYSMTEAWGVTEETLQEVAVYVCNHWDDFTPGSNFGQWVRAIARNRCREILHREKRERILTGSVGASIPDEAWDREGDYDHHKIQALHECVKKLPEKSRRILEMHYRDGWDCARVAGHFDCRLDSIYKALLRLRTRLEECIAASLSEN